MKLDLNDYSTYSTLASAMSGDAATRDQLVAACKRLGEVAEFEYQTAKKWCKEYSEQRKAAESYKTSVRKALEGFHREQDRADANARTIAAQAAEIAKLNAKLAEASADAKRFAKLAEYRISVGDFGSITGSRALEDARWNVDALPNRPAKAWKFGDPFDPPAGFRFVEVGETIAIGDRYCHPQCGGLYGNAIGSFGGDTRAGKVVTKGDRSWGLGQLVRAVSSAKPYGNSTAPAYGATFERGPVPNEYAGEGWRFVEVGETLQAGDEGISQYYTFRIQCYYGTEIVPRGSNGGSFNRGNYRRRVETAKPSARAVDNARR